MTPSTAIIYDERLTTPRSWWLIAFLAGVSMGLIVLPYGTLPMLGGLVIGTAVACMWVSTQGSPRIRIVSGLLVVGDAKIPVNALGTPQVLEEEEARAWRTYKADMRAHMVMRSYIATAVRIDVIDPDDPTPYLYLSTRSPQRLSDVLTAAQEA